MKAYFFLLMIISHLSPTNGVIQSKEHKDDVSGEYLLVGLVRIELKIRKNLTFEKYNSSRVAGAGVWTEFGTWRQIGDTVELNINYSISKFDKNRVEKGEILTLVKMDRELCELEKNNCFKKIK